MRKLFTLIIIALLFVGCSSNDESTNEETVIDNPSTPTESKLFRVHQHASQIVIYLEKADGSPVIRLDYADDNYMFQVKSGDKLTVTSKVGHEVLPSVAYTIGNSDKFYLLSRENTSQFQGYRLMVKPDLTGYIIIE